MVKCGANNRGRRRGWECWKKRAPRPFNHRKRQQQERQFVSSAHLQGSERYPRVTTQIGLVHPHGALGATVEAVDGNERDLDWLP
jgi:hypothetical protein